MEEINVAKAIESDDNAEEKEDTRRGVAGILFVNKYTGY